MGKLDHHYQQNLSCRVISKTVTCFPFCKRSLALAKWANWQPCILVIAISIGQAVAFSQEAGDLRELPNPVDVDELIVFTQTPEGLLFVASEEQLFIRSPFGDRNGWEQIRELNLDNGDRIVDVSVFEGISQTELLVVTEQGLHIVEWESIPVRASPWDVFRYQFRCRSLTSELALSNSNVHSFAASGILNSGESSVRAWIANKSEIVPLIASGGAIHLGDPIQTNMVSMPLWSPSIAGWSFAWGYSSHKLWTLGPDGTVDGEPADLAAVLAPEGIDHKHVDIHCVWRDTRRNVLFVGTSHGLAVADVAPESGHRVTEFARVDAIGLATVKQIGDTAGRLWFLTDSKDAIDGYVGPLLMEATQGRRCEVASDFTKMKLFSPAPSNGPERVVNVVVVDNDRVFVDDGNAFWFWTLGQWKAVESSRLDLRDLSIGDSSARGIYPSVVSDLITGNIWYFASDNDSYLRVRPVPLAGQTRWLVPDVSGQGVWAISEGSAAATEYGAIAFHTPHGSLQHGDYGITGGPTRIRIKSLSLRLANGEQILACESSWWFIAAVR